MNNQDYQNDKQLNYVFDRISFNNGDNLLPSMKGDQAIF